MEPYPEEPDPPKRGGVSQEKELFRDNMAKLGALPPGWYVVYEAPKGTGIAAFQTKLYGWKAEYRGRYEITVRSKGECIRVYARRLED